MPLFTFLYIGVRFKSHTCYAYTPKIFIKYFKGVEK